MEMKVKMETLATQTQKPYLYVNVLTSDDQFCVCNMDKAFFRPVLAEAKDPKFQMWYALTVFLQYHKQKPKRDALENDEFPYYMGSVYNRNELTYKDVEWRFNVPHSSEMSIAQLEDVRKLTEPMKALLDEMGIDYKVYGVW